MTQARTNEDRCAAENRARLMLIRLICTASIARTALTRLLPLAGSAAWWVTLLCLLPGLAVYMLIALALRAARASTLTELARVCLGSAGKWGVSLLLGMLLLLEGVASLTALVTLFTQGIGTRGTQLTLSVLTALALIPALHREGLARGVSLLRWPMLALALILAVCAIPQMHLDGLFPLAGEGVGAAQAALRDGASLTWPLALLFTVEGPDRKSRASGVLLPCAWCVGLLLALAMLLPHARLVASGRLAESLLLPFASMPMALRLLGQCLLMLLLFLSVGGCTQQSLAHLCAPFGKAPSWLPGAFAALLVLTQAGDVSRLWKLLACLEPWLLMPLLLLAALCLLAAPLRRNKP